MRKTLKIDLSSDRLIAVAGDMVEAQNLIGALKMLNKNADLNCNDCDSYMLYAEIFDDMGLYEKSVNSWFKFMDCSFDGEYPEAYEGLAVGYMNLGNEHFSAYYYNRLLMGTDEIDAETRSEILSSFLDKEENPLKFVYPPQIADCSEIISDGIGYMKSGEYDRAIAEFDKIEEGNDSYLAARNYIAMCNIICDKCEEAESECLNILEKNPDSVQALTTLAAVRTEQKRGEESRELAMRLLKLNPAASEDIYKIATVCCENKLHAEACRLFTKLEKELPYDVSLLYFKAVSAFNCGKTEESFAAFDKLLAINPDAVTADYYYSKAREAAENGEQLELSYFYRLPQNERESSLKVLAAFAALNSAQAKKMFSVVDITDCILWTFDECEGGEDGDLQSLAALCAVKAGLDGIVCDILLNAFLSDGLKVRILTALGERNEDNTFGVVICHLYKRVTFRPLDIGRAKRKRFVSAYAGLTAHFGVINITYSEKFAKAAETLYAELENGGNLSKVSDTDALTAAIYIKSGVRDPKIKRSELSAFFNTTDKKITDILGEQ